MRTLATLTPLALIALVAGCDPTVTFAVEQEGETTIEGQGIIGDLIGAFAFTGFGSIDFSESAAFRNNNTQKNQVRSARALLIQLETTAPEGADFQFLDEISFFVEAPGLPRARVASRVVDDPASPLSLELDALDLGPYVRADSFAIDTEASGRPPANDTTVSARVVVEIVAGL